jgi:hypothetical protein
MLSRFPPLQRARFYTQLPSHRRLRQSERLARSDEAFTKRVGRRKRVITEKLNNGGDVSDCWTGCVVFPVDYRHSVYADLRANLPLKEPEVETASADMVA